MVMNLTEEKEGGACVSGAGFFIGVINFDGATMTCNDSNLFG